MSNLIFIFSEKNILQTKKNIFYIFCELPIDMLDILDIPEINLQHIYSYV